MSILLTRSCRQLVLDHLTRNNTYLNYDTFLLLSLDNLYCHELFFLVLVEMHLHYADLSSSKYSFISASYL